MAIIEGTSDRVLDAAPPSPRVDDELPPVMFSVISRRRFLTRSVAGLGLATVAGGVASGLVTFAGSRPPPGPVIKTRAETFPWFLEWERPQRFRKLVVMPFPANALPMAEEIYEERILVGMRKGYVVLVRHCPRDANAIVWFRRYEWFMCVDCGATFSPVGELRFGPAPRGMDHVGLDASTTGQLEISPDIVFPGAPVGTNSAGEERPFILIR